MSTALTEPERLKLGEQRELIVSRSSLTESEKARLVRAAEIGADIRSQARRAAGGTAISAAPTDLYRVFDSGGALLYVGISLSIAQRVGQHRHSSGWWAEVALIEVEHHPDRDAAAKAERHAIRTEAPLHNAQVIA